MGLVNSTCERNAASFADPDPMSVLGEGDFPVGLVTKQRAKLAHAISPFRKTMQDHAIMASVDDAINHAMSEPPAKSLETLHIFPAARRASAGQRWYAYRQLGTGFQNLAGFTDCDVHCRAGQAKAIANLRQTEPAII